MPWSIPDVLEAIRAKLVDRDTPADLVERHLHYHRSVLRELEKRYEHLHPRIGFRGIGGSGVVITLEETAERSARALKYPLPTLGLLGTLSLADILDNEADRLQRLHHQHIIPVDDVGRISLTQDPHLSTQDLDVPYYLMPFVDAVDLSEFVTSAPASGELLAKLLHQVSTALLYIHDEGYVHLDVKPGNIFVQDYRKRQPSALLADFGFCKRVVKGSESLTLVMGTEDYLHPRLRRLMRNPSQTDRRRIRDRVPRTELDPAFDRYAFGLTLAESLMSFLSAEAADPRAVSASLLRSFQLIALRCADGEAASYRMRSELHPVLWERLFKPEVANQFHYVDTAALVSNLRYVVSGPTDDQVEAEVAQSSPEIVCIPPRSFAPLSDRAKRTLDSLPVRRLSQISQLALSYHVYPGAAHTRKEHVLGTYLAVARLLRRLILDAENPLAALLLTPRHQRAALLAAFLHDMAHIPLMHEFEDSVPELTQERYLAGILAGEWGGPDFQREIDSLLADWDVTRSELIVLLGPRKSKKVNGSRGAEVDLGERADWELVRSLLDGAVDADKIDYLQRDAVHAGVPFGHGVDFERIERTTTAGLWLEGREGAWAVRCRLAAWKKGQAAAEAVIAVRHSMYAQVYAHRTVRAARAMLNYVTWCWSMRTPLADDTAHADLLFESGSGLTRKGQTSLLQTAVEEDLRLEPTPRDNLPFREARLIRWLGRRSAVPAALKMAEALIERQLYREVCVLAENEVEGFLSRTYPRARGRGRHGPAVSAEDWLHLTEHLDASVATFLRESLPKLTRPLVLEERPGELPRVLVDVAIPKTMRTQKELVVVNNQVGAKVSWKRVESMAHAGGGEGCVWGLEVESSPIYEVFGGRGGGEQIGTCAVRLFARPDLLIGALVR